MAVTLTAWPDNDANSYVALADADEYFDARLGSDSWDTTDDKKKQALITATRMIDRQRWQGEKADPDQPLAWPRTGVVDKYGDDVPSDELPPDLILGVYELALSLLEDETVQDQSAAGSNIKHVKAGSVEVDFFRGTFGLVGKFPQIINELLAQYLSGVNAAGGISSGTDRESFFDDDANAFLMDDFLP